jgi:SAM-dependent methyltransferase
MSTTETAPANPAEMYEGFFVPSIFAPWATELIGRAAPRPGERVLDIACGTGAVTRQVAPLVGQSGSVTGLDMSPGMLAVARALPAPEGAPIAWHEGSAEALPFADGSFDLVLCQQSVQFFPGRAAAVGEMRRVLRPGGRVGVAVWRGIEHQSLYHAFDLAAERHLGKPEEGGPFSFGDAGALRGLFAEAGFNGIAVEVVTRPVRFPDPERFVHLTILATAAVMPEYERMDDAARQALAAADRRDLDGPLQEHLADGALVFPMSAHILTARH